MVDDYVSPGFVDDDYVEGGDTPSLGFTPAYTPYTPSGQHSTDFREYRRGRVPGDWTPRWGATDEFLVDGAAHDLAHRNILQIRGVAAADSNLALSWDAPEGDTGFADQEIRLCQRLRSRTTADETMLRGVLRGSGTTSATANGYAATIALDLGFQAQIVKVVNGAHTVIASTVKNFEDAVWVHMKFRANGTTLQLTVWADGDAEPGSPNVTITDATHAAGWVGVMARQPGHVTDIRYFAVGTDGASAPDELDIEDPLESWISEYEDDIDVTVRCEYYNPFMGTVNEQWFSRDGRTTRADDYPAATTIEPYLLDPGTLSARLEADTPLSAAVSPSRTPIRLSNLPFVEGAGPLDDWPSYSFHGRPIEIRAGRKWKTRPSPTSPGVLMPHRRYEIVGCALASREPEVTNEDATITLGPPSNVLADLVPVSRNVGISTGIKSLTASGWLSIPSSVSYELSSFVIYLRVFIPAAGVPGTGVCNLSRRQVDPTLRQWHIALYQSGTSLAHKLHFISYRPVGGVTVSHITDGTYNMGRAINIIYGINGNSDQWYAYVDNDRVGSGISLGAPDTAAGQIVEVIGGSSVGVTVLDHRIEQWVSEDEALARFSARREPDSLTVSMHRCDDNAGDVVTDYAPLANHGTLQGTESIDGGMTGDRLWVASHLGSAGTAGTSMPFSGGVLFHAPTQAVDPIREQFRFNDRAPTAGVAVEVRAKGLLLTSGVAYTLPPDGPGVVDIDGASDQPVTFGLVPSAGAENPAYHIPRLAVDELLSRNALGVETCDVNSFYALRQVLPMRGGFHYTEPPSVSDFLSALLGPLGSYFTIDRDGRVAAGIVTPPINPGPYLEQAKLLEFLGLPEGGVTFSDNVAYRLTQTAGDFGLLCWFKLPHKFVPDASVVSTGDYSQPGYTIIDKMAGGTTGFFLGLDGDTGALRFAAGGITFGGGANHYVKLGDANTWPVDTWLAASVRVKAGTCLMEVQTWNGLADTTAQLSTAAAGSLSDSPNIPLRIGHGPQGSFVGPISSVIGCSPAQAAPGSIAAMLSDTGSTSGTDRFRISLNEGAGDRVADSVQSRTGYVSGARWCPRLTMDFTTVSSDQPPVLRGVRRPIPAWRVDPRYKENHHPLEGANVAAGVSTTDRIALGQPYLSKPSTSNAVKDRYLNSRDVPIRTPVASAEHAEYLAHFLRVTRLGTNRRFSGLSWYRDALKIDLTDEILVVNDRFSEFSTGKSIRAVMLSFSLADLRGDSEGWG